MKSKKFPENFIWGTSTASTQIETATDHDWKDVIAKDGAVFNETCDHEKRREEDADIISYLAPYYRMSMDWSNLQSAPYAQLNPEIVREYMEFLEDLNSKNVKILLVLHHFTNPNWFVKNGNWENEENINVFVDYSKKIIDVFGDKIDLWNTFNEPCVYVTNSRIVAQFPPFKSSVFDAISVINNLSKAHHEIYDYIHSKFPHSKVGISKNTVYFEGLNTTGKGIAKIMNWWFNDYCNHLFAKKMDFQGVSYYARIPLNPLPISELEYPGKLKSMGREHDDMWDYYPEGMRHNIYRYWNRYKIPIIITESGICTNDDSKRIKALQDYLKIISEMIEDGVDIRGYFFWSTMDNFEWNIGPSYKFGLVEVDPITKERRKRPSAHYYRNITSNNKIDF